VDARARSCSGAINRKVLCHRCDYPLSSLLLSRGVKRIAQALIDLLLLPSRKDIMNENTPDSYALQAVMEYLERKDGP
jgi:hypothetical protein